MKYIFFLLLSDAQLSVVNHEQIKALAEELKVWIKEKTNAPILIRAAWHDSGTYDKDSTKPWPKVGGADGSIRFKSELCHCGNAGLSGIVQQLNDIKAKYPEVSYADAFQLAAVIAIEVSGGPHINLRFGRLDCTKEEFCPDEGNLPSGASPFPGAVSALQHIRNVFYRMGLNDKELVILSGAHTLGRVHKNRSGATDRISTAYTDIVKEGATPGGSSWTKKWLKFDNAYFKELLSLQDQELIALETDKALVEDPELKKYVELYAQDQDAFFKDYIPAQIKLSELGSKFINDTPVEVQY